jgi:hypothetical protein
MTKIKVTHKTMMANFEFPIEVGQVKMKAVGQAFIYKDKKSGKLEGDFEFIDYTNITYMSMPIENHGGMEKLKIFHNDLGINLTKLIDDEFNKVVTEEFKQNFIKQFEEKIFEL